MAYFYLLRVVFIVPSFLDELMSRAQVLYYLKKHVTISLTTYFWYYFEQQLKRRITNTMRHEFLLETYRTLTLS